MTIHYNADEVFMMGVDIERNGQEFYHVAAEHTDDQAVAKIFRSLETAEKKHEKLFESLRKKLPRDAGGATIFDPYGQSDQYLAALAETHVFDFQDEQEMIETIASCDSPRDVLELALRFEKESMIFFLWMKDHTKPEWGRDRIDQLIREEQAHVVRIYREMERLERD